MFMIDYVTPEKAEGSIEKIYSFFPEGIPVPDSLQLYSASPRYLERQWAAVGDLMADDAYDQGLLAALRYIGASTACFGYCSQFNKQMLNSMGLTEEEVDALATNPSAAFEEKDAALITFVAKSTANPDDVTQADIEAVRNQGWTDQQVFETTAYAAQMATVGIVFRTFSNK